MRELKIVLLGDPGVGKTNLIKCLITSKEVDSYVPTVGVQIHPIVIKGNLCYIWDFAGDETYMGKIQWYFNKTDVCVILGPNKEKWETIFRYTSNAPIIEIDSGDMKTVSEKFITEITTF